MGKQIEAATEAAREHGQPVSEIVRRYAELSEEGKKTGFSIEGLGNAIKNFAENPIEAARSGITDLIGTLGPFVTGLTAIVAGAGAAAKAIYDLGEKAIEAAEANENLSAISGLTVQQIQTLTEIDKQAGLENLDLARTLGLLN